MRIIERRLQGATVLELHGILTGTAATELLDATVRRVTRAGPQRLVLDLEDVPSIDAAGLGTLVTGYRVVTRSGGTLRLTHVAKRVHVPLVVCGLVTAFEIFDSVDEAVADGSGRSRDRTTGSATPQLSQPSPM